MRSAGTAATSCTAAPSSSSPSSFTRDGGSCACCCSGPAKNDNAVDDDDDDDDNDDGLAMEQLARTLGRADWPRTFARQPIGALESLLGARATLVGVLEALTAELKHRFEHGLGKLPPEAQSLCDGRTTRSTVATTPPVTRTISGGDGGGGGSCCTPSSPSSGDDGANDDHGQDANHDGGSSHGDHGDDGDDDDDDDDDDDAHHKRLIRATVRYVVRAAPYAHASRLVEGNVRRLLGLGPEFTTNLDWAGGAFAELQAGVHAHMRRLGSPLDAMYVVPITIDSLVVDHQHLPFRKWVGCNNSRAVRTRVLGSAAARKGEYCGGRHVSKSC